MPHEPDDHPGPTKAPPAEPEGEPMVGKPATPPDDPTNAVHRIAGCVSFAAAARRKRRFVYSPPSGARPAQPRDAAPGVIVLRTHEMRLRFGIGDRTEAQAETATDALD
jgi:hypothetical protein